MGPGVRAMTEPTRALAPGQIVAGAYRVDGPLDSGGYAQVYLGTRLADGLRVAVKAMRLDVSHGDPAAPERFAREAAMVARLEHPNLVRILDFGRIEDTVLYMVMERLVGTTLESILFAEPLAPERVLHILRQILDALVVAHGQGAVHRDLKPSNIFLCPVASTRPGDPMDWVKILDFGFARGITNALGKEMRRTLTLDGAIVCTPEIARNSRRVTSINTASFLSGIVAMSPGIPSEAHHPVTGTGAAKLRFFRVEWLCRERHS